MSRSHLRSTSGRAQTRQQQQAQRRQTQRDAARAPRRNGQARITAQAARQGRFATAYARQRPARWHDPAWRAWRRGGFAYFVPWFGPVFWPYAYSDIFDYAFWPYGYDDGYWAFAYDDFFDGLFWGQVGPPAVYAPDAYAYAPASSGRRARRQTAAAVQELCQQPGSGVTAWPFAEIESKVGLTDEQKQLLDDVRSAAAKAADTFKASCPSVSASPLTPPGRLAAMTARLQATLDAVDTVRPALDKFYNALSDEQKERFNEIGPKQPKKAGTQQASTDEAQSCKQPKPGLANLPIEKIEDVVQPTGAQEDGLNKLQDATNKAVATLQAACPDETPLTPTGRLEAMQKRLKAMIDAADTVRPALESFYGSLSNEQKARFNRIGRDLAQAGANG